VLPLAVASWPDVVLSLIAAFPATLAAWLAYLNRRQIRTPSGDTLGAVAERTHDITHATSMQVGQMDRDYKRDHDDTPKEDT
jgi:cobalamin synthase